MGIRRDLRDGLLEKIKTLFPAATVEKWKGGEEAFNSTAIHPAIYIGYLGADISPSLEIGAATYDRSPNFGIFVCANDDETAGDGDDQAMEILEAIETNITGDILSDLGAIVTSGNERLINAHAGRFLYMQQYSVDTLESHEIDS